MPIASSRPRAAEQVLGGQLTLQAHPVRVDGDDVGVAVADQFLHGVHGQPVGGRDRGPVAEDLEQPCGRPLRLGQDGLVQRPVAGDDVARHLQLVERELHLAAVVEVRFEAGPVLDHQLAQLRQREEAQDVVVGRVEQVALAARDLPHGDGALHPLLSRGPRGGHHPVLAVHRLVDRPDHGGDHGTQPLFHQIQPDVGTPRPLGARAHLVPGVRSPVQLSTDLHGLCEGDSPRRGIGRFPLVTRVTWGQLEPSRAHPCTAFHSPTNDQGRVLR